MYTNASLNSWNVIQSLNETWEKVKIDAGNFSKDIDFLKVHFELSKDDLKTLTNLEQSFYQNIVSEFHWNIGSASNEMEALIKITQVMGRIISHFMLYTRLFHKLLLTGKFKETV